jgi:hypothetical protein
MKDMNARTNVDQLFETVCKVVEVAGRDGFIHAGCVPEESPCGLSASTQAQAGAHDDHLDYSDTGWVDAHGDHGDQ